MTIVKNIIKKISYTNHFKRRLLLLIIDISILIISIWLCLILNSQQLIEYNQNTFAWIFPTTIFLSLPVYLLTGQYTGITRYINSTDIYKIILRHCIVLILVISSGMIFKFILPNYQFWISLAIVICFISSVIRITIRDIIGSIQSLNSENVKRIVIYGAGSFGAQIANSLSKSKKHNVLSFIDDSPKLWDRNINGISIRNPKELFNLKNKIDEILIAIPSIKKNRLKELIDNLKDLNIPVFQMPTLNDIYSGKSRIESIRPVKIEDLLGRDEAKIKSSLLRPNIEGKNIFISGAGGSIGSELCRQMCKYNPNKIILFELSEPNLYNIHIELVTKYKSIEIVPILGNASNYSLVQKIFNEHYIEIVYHAAAYKHVPMIEYNPLSGISNNIFSTRVICKASINSNVNQLVLISTDKAVRPTNVMGATKRLAELIVQAEAEKMKSSFEGNNEKLFSMVRFGNVLGSSGSVVPLFNKQIAKGGPLTITHPDIIRYFMTIQEAAKLVLQVPSLAQGGDVFLLDMGEPVKILDLAKQMIKLAGLTLKDETNKDGDIEIVYTGLRAGEKLYEELLIDSDSLSTQHSHIFSAKESFIDPELLFKELDNLEIAVNSLDITKSLNIMSKLVPEWKSKF